jgi:hypothetical protein
MGRSTVLVLKKCDTHTAGPHAITVGQHVASKSESNTKLSGNKWPIKRIVIPHFSAMP